MVGFIVGMSVGRGNGVGADVGAGRDVGIAEGSIGTAVGMIVGVVVGCSGDSGLIGDTAVGASRTQAPAPTTSNKPKTMSVFFISHTPGWVYLFCLPANNNCTLKLPRHRLQQIQRLDDAIPPEAHFVPEHKRKDVSRCLASLFVRQS